jgi:hypothetical protein
MRIDTLNFRVIKWCELVLKSVAARRLAVADGRKYWNRQAQRSEIRLGSKYLECSGLDTTWQWQKDIFPTPAFCRCCGGKLGCKGD